MSRGDGGRRRRRAQRVYRLLMLLYPAAHRRRFGEQMLQSFGDHHRDVVEDRGGSRLRFWLSVLADVAVSVLTERVADLVAWWRRARTPSRRPRRRRTGRARTAGVRERRRRVAPRLRYRRRGRRPARVAGRVAGRGRRRLINRGRIAVLIALLVLAGATPAVGAVTGHLRVGGLTAGLVVAVGLALSLRLARPVSAGPGDGPAPPGGASVREPRRPLPTSPAGCGARPGPDADEPGQAVALI